MPRSKRCRARFLSWLLVWAAFPKLVEDGTNGFLHHPDDLDGMAHSAIRLLTDEVLHRSAAAAARRAAQDKYCDSKIVPPMRRITRR